MAQASVRRTGQLQTDVFLYDFSVHGGAVGDILTGLMIPKGAIIQNVFADVIVAPTSADSTATIAVKAESANDLFTAAAVSGAPWSTTGRKQGIPDFATVADYKKTTVEREVTISIAVQALTAGKVDVYVQYVDGNAVG